MIVIYDFDGTLTPYTLPQYAIIKKCGYDELKFMDRISKDYNKLDIYSAYWKCYKDVLLENNFEISRDNICFNANNVELNKGVVDYFKKFQSSRTSIKHYIVTSGIKDYIEETPISNFVDGIFGTTFDKEKVNILTDKDKVDVIKRIQEENQMTNDIIYFGDGLTDRLAFQYVHNIGGISVFIMSNEKFEINYQKLNNEGIIDKCFTSDFSENSEINEFIEKWRNK